MDESLKSKLIKMARMQGYQAEFEVDGNGQRKAVLKQGDKTLISLPAGQAETMARQLKAGTFPIMEPAEKLAWIVEDPKAKLRCDDIGCTTCGAMPLRAMIRQFDTMEPAGLSAIKRWAEMLRQPTQNELLTQAIEQVDWAALAQRVSTRRLLMVCGMIVSESPNLREALERPIKQLAGKVMAGYPHLQQDLQDWRLESYKSLTPLYADWQEAEQRNLSAD